MELFNYNYDNYTDDLCTIIYAIEKSRVKYDMIVGVQRGGVIPATHLSYVYDTPFVSLTWSSQIGKVRDSSNQPIKCALERGQKVLVIDDICDSGITLDDIKKTYEGVDTACLIYNEINNRNFVPTYHGWKINRKELTNWFKFWWEIK